MTISIDLSVCWLDQQTVQGNIHALLSVEREYLRDWCKSG